MQEYQLVFSYENHAWGENYLTIVTTHDGKVYKNNEKLDGNGFTFLLKSRPFCNIKKDKMEKISNLVKKVYKSKSKLQKSGNSIDAGITKYAVHIHNPDGSYRYLVLGIEGDEPEISNNEDINNLKQEISNITKAVMNYEYELKNK
jgi:hypothetical protein